MSRLRARRGIGSADRGRHAPRRSRGLRPVRLVQAQRDAGGLQPRQYPGVSESSPTTPLKTGVFVEQMYRSCLSAKGWVRDKQYDPPPPGW